jgi:hypothetical protein
MRDLQTPVAGFRSPFGALSQTGTAAFTKFSVRPYFVMDTPKNKYLTSGPEVSNNLSELMTSVALGNATVIDKGGALKWRLHNFITGSATLTDTANGLRVQSGGSGSDRASNVTEDLVDGAKYTWNFEYTAGTSGSVRFQIFDGSPSVNLNVNGAVGAAAVSATTGTTEITVTNEDLGGNSYRLTVVATMDAGGAVNHSAGFGPDSSVVGEDIYLTKAWSYRSDLGGMQLNSKDGTDYLSTAGAAGYALRRDYSRLPVDGQILGEPAGTDLLPYNVGADISSSNWSENGTTTVTTGATTLLGIPASLIDVGGVGSSLGPDRISMNATLSASTQHCAWAVVSSVDCEIAGFRAFCSGGAGDPDAQCNFIFASRTFSNNADVDSSGYLEISPEVFLVWFTFTTGTGTSCSFRIGGHIGGGETTGDQFYVAFAQIEAYHTFTSVIPAKASSEARAKDEASCVIADSIPGFIQGSGSLVFEGSIDYETGGSAFGHLVLLGGDTSDNLVRVQCQESINSYRIQVKSAGSTAAVLTTAVATGVISRVAFRWVEDDFSCSWDGATVIADLSGTEPTGITTVHFGDDGGVIAPVRISHFSIGPYASPVASPGWSNAQLAVISGS